MRVLVTATTFPRWKKDTEPEFVFLLSKLLAKHHDISVLVPHHFRAKSFEYMDKLKVYRFTYFYPAKFQRLCYDGGIRPNIKKSWLARIQVLTMPISFLLSTIKLVKKNKINIIHAHWIIPEGFIAFVVKKIFKIPYIITAHAGDIFPLRQSFLRFFAKMALENCDLCTVNSNATKKAVLKVAKIKNIKLVPMGVDLRSFNKNKKSKKTRKLFSIKKEFILFVGRLAEKKGVKYLIKAMQSLVKEFPQSKLIIVGDGPEKGKLELLTKKLGLSNDILFAGKIPNKDLPKIYASSDLFVLPSIVTKSGDTEGLGVVLLEAIASGIACVASDVGGIPDIIKHEKTGLLVEQKNTKELAKAMIRLLKDKKLRNKVVKNAQQHVKKNYSWNVVIKKFKKIYQSMSDLYVN